MLTRLELPPSFSVLCAIMVKERSSEQSKTAGGQDWNFKAHCSSYVSLNLPSAFLN